ncbi:YpdA family putative bacillithiol disulfide reductase [Bacillus horti]|uniref:Thioredoxin reductase (NADPH) n=1 Tax=Caldalkalibacillus horti TaxID=77523 RepID=A0ABT9VZ92_9BACI|nr:YpdA family putative bacillithiol disulfide reductase [Bacillus horti]MDQ0166318.1 thioredoxin reductase (NADPH) [Bacillus horti]
MTEKHQKRENDAPSVNSNHTVIHENILIIGAGPCGLAAAIALQEQGFEPLVIDKGNVVHTLSRYPTHQTFFSSAEKLEIGGLPFTIEQRKPNRSQALAYYREVAKRKKIRIQPYVEVLSIVPTATTESGSMPKINDVTDLGTSKESEEQKIEQGKMGEKEKIGQQIATSSSAKPLFQVHGHSQDKQDVYYTANYVILATGYYDNPNLMCIPGEELNKVFHYFHEAHPFYDQHVTVIGGKNSAVDAALELEKVGAHVTVLYRGETYSSSVKPWILPEFDALVRHGKVAMEFGAEVIEIKEKELSYKINGEVKTIANDFVFAMTGYHPDHAFLHKLGVGTDSETGRPHFAEETMETNVPNVFIAGVIAAGNNANEIFIENGRFHGELIAKEIANREGM